MNSRFVLPLLALACCVVSACAPLRNIERTRTERAPIAGGYSRTANAHDPASAAAFAAREESRRKGMPIRVVHILKSDTQVVAGTNIRLRIAAQRNGASTETAEVVVYRDFKGHLHLSSWRWVNR